MKRKGKTNTNIEIIKVKSLINRKTNNKYLTLISSEK